MSYFFLPLWFRVVPNAGEEHVIVQQRTILGIFEFMRLPISDAHRFADFLDKAADNAEADPLVPSQVGEINAIYVRALGTGEIRVRLSAKRPDKIVFAIRTCLKKFGRSTKYGRPKIAPTEARRFATCLRDTKLPVPKQG